MDDELLEKEVLELRAERDRMHNAPVAQVIANETRKKRVICVAAILLVLIIVAVVLAVMLTREPSDPVADLLKCSYESLALLEDNTDLEKAFNASVDEISDAEEDCGEKRNCTVNQDTFPSTLAFESACGAAEGNLYKTSFRISCSGDDSFNFVYHNIRDCLALSCTDSMVQSSVKASVENIRSSFEDDIGGGSVDCDATERTITDPSGNALSF